MVGATRPRMRVTDMSDYWMVTGDLRRPGSGWEDSNHEYVEAVAEAVTQAGFTNVVSRISTKGWLPKAGEFSYDPEDCQTYVYFASEEEARRAAPVIAAVAAERWAGVASAASRVTATCPECGRVFDLGNVDDAAEWSYGHDCEVE